MKRLTIKNVLFNAIRVFVPSWFGYRALDYVTQGAEELAAAHASLAAVWVVFFLMESAYRSRLAMLEDMAKDYILMWVVSRRTANKVARELLPREEGVSDECHDRAARSYVQHIYADVYAEETSNGEGTPTEDKNANENV